MTVLKFGGKFKKGAYQDLRRPARRGRHRGKFSLRLVRGGSPPQRPRLSAGIRTRRAHGRRPPHRPHRPPRHQDHLQARRADLPQHHISIQRPLQAVAGAGVPQPGRKDHLQGPAQGDGETFCYKRGILEFIEFLNRASSRPTKTSSTSARSRRALGWRLPCNTPRSLPRTSTPT